MSENTNSKQNKPIETALIGTSACKEKENDLEPYMMHNDNCIPVGMEALVDILLKGGYACVIGNKEQVRAFVKRGVADLYTLLHDEPDFLSGAQVADKVVGKGAASLMILGGVRRVYALVMSEPAFELLQSAGMEVACGEKVSYIRNRANTGCCPLESLCGEASTAAEALPLIERFLASFRQA